MFVVMIIWGFVLVGAGFCNNFASIMVTRVLLGALEAPVAPGNFIIMTMWYTRKEQPLRAGMFYTGQCLTLQLVVHVLNTLPFRSLNNNHRYLRVGCGIHPGRECLAELLLDHRSYLDCIRDSGWHFPTR